MILFFIMNLSFVNLASAQHILHGGEDYIYADEAKDVEDFQEWMAIYKNENSTQYIKKIKIRSWIDPEIGIAPRRMVRSDASAIYVIGGVSGIKEGAITFSKLGGSLKLGDHLKLDGGAVIYKTGNFSQNKDGTFASRNYQYFLRLLGKTHKLNLPDNDTHARPMNIVWTGDINGDGFPDFIIHNSYDGERDAGTDLYMSQKNGDKWDFIKTASYPYQGC